MQVYPTVYAAFCASASQAPENTCLETTTARLTYREAELQVRRLAGTLQRRQKLRKGQAVIVLCDNDPHWLIVSLAIQAIGAVEFPRSAGISSHELTELQKATGCRHFVVADPVIVRRHRGVFSKPRVHITVMSGSAQAGSNAVALADIVAAADNNLPVHIETHAVSAVICTSGTTGRPKQVPVLQASFLHSMRVIPRLLNTNSRDVFLSCLPSWHLYARIVEYTALASGAKIVYSGIPELAERLRTSGCTIFPSFPEIWEKIYHEILLRLENVPGKTVRRLINLSIATNRLLENNASRARYRRQKPGFLSWLKLAYLLPLRTLLMATVFRAIRRQISPTLRYAIMGDAPLPLAVDEMLRAIGFEVLEGYGSTEQCVTALRRPGRHFPGVIGRILPGVEVATHDTLSAELNGITLGEIAVRGDNVFRGYFTSMRNLRENNLQPITYLTGDIGHVTAGRNLVIVGRKANAFRLKSGRIIFPELIENVLRGSKYVGRVVVFGDDEIAPVALVVPDFTALLHWLGPYGGYQKNPGEAPQAEKAFWKQAVASAPVQQLYAGEFERLLNESGIPPQARPGGFRLLAQPFHRGHELTPTLKVRRTEIARLYRGELRALFQQQKKAAVRALLDGTGRAV